MRALTKEMYYNDEKINFQKMNGTFAQKSLQAKNLPTSMILKSYSLMNQIFETKNNTRP